MADVPPDLASRTGLTDTMAAELAGWAAGELPGQASARLAAWASVGGAVARGRKQAHRGGGSTAAGAGALKPLASQPAPAGRAAARAAGVRRSDPAGPAEILERAFS